MRGRGLVVFRWCGTLGGGLRGRGAMGLSGGWPGEKSREHTPNDDENGEGMKAQHGLHRIMIMKIDVSSSLHSSIPIPPLQNAYHS